MKEKELRRMNREALLELLIERTDVIEALQAQLAEAQEQAETARRELEALQQEKPQPSCEEIPAAPVQTVEPGSIAEVAARVSGVFEAADQTAKVYLENIRHMQDEQTRIHEEMMAESRRQAGQIVAEARVQAEGIVAEAQRQIEQIEADARAQAEAIVADAQRLAGERLVEASRWAEQTKAEAHQEAEARLAEAEKQCSEQEAETRRRCEEMLAEAEQDPSRRLVELSGQVEQIIRENAELRGLIAGQSSKKRKWRL